jgi:hypothetical protein
MYFDFEWEDHIVIYRIRPSSLTDGLPFTRDDCDFDHYLMVAEVKSANEKTDLLYENILLEEAK